MTETILGALAIGMTLGLLGSGGSILTVPVLVYVLGHNEKVAIAESLAIVGGIALAGMLTYARARLVHWKSVVFFGLPGMGGTQFGAWLARFIPGPAQLVLFAVVMLVAAVMMVRKPKGASAADGDDDSVSAAAHPLWQLVLEGVGVGILTGLVGVGGGFLIVPSLVILGGLSMRLAIGTSLMVIAMTAFSGFFKYLSVLTATGLRVDWETIGVFLLVGIAGSGLGKALNQRVNQAALRKVFAGFLLLMGFFVLAREVPRMVGTPVVRPTEASVRGSLDPARQLRHLAWGSRLNSVQTFRIQPTYVTVPACGGNGAVTTLDVGRRVR